jgi:cysteinyl-tRNA synthetase, unknown class
VTEPQAPKPNVIVAALVTLEALVGAGLSALARGIKRLSVGAGRMVSALLAQLDGMPTHVKRAVAAITAVAVLLTGVWTLRDGPVNWYASSFDKRPLLRAKSWHYQLDKIDIDEMSRSTADLVVMDSAREGGRTLLSKAEVARMKVLPDGGRRLAVAYISIGEAEHYRYYWQADWNDPQKAATRPKWLGRANCAWPDNNAVNFWSPDWKKIIYNGPESFIARIANAGFDGVYLDRVDIYEQYTKDRPDAEGEMVRFVTELAAAGRAINPDFIVIAQNGEDLLQYRRYRRVIDGLGKEDLLHGHQGTGTRNPPKDIDWSYDRLKWLLADHKPVFAVEYMVTRESIAEAKLELAQRGLIGTSAHRNLDGTDPAGPRFETKVAMGTPEYIAANCAPGTAW